MYPPMRNITAKKLDGGYEVSRNATHIKITKEITEEDRKYLSARNKRYGEGFRIHSKPMVISAYFNALPGCCSGTVLSRMIFGKPLGGKKYPSIVQRAELLKLLTTQFSEKAMLMYVVRSDNSNLPKTFNKARWKKSRGPVGRYSPYNYTLDIYTIDPRTPKRKLPSLKPVEKNRVGFTALEEKPIVLTGRQKYIGRTVKNIKRRLNELREHSYLQR